MLRTLAALPLVGRQAHGVTSRSNIVILLADDLGHGDLGATGCTDIATPHIDSLARDGARFTHAYSNAPVCSPTRAALLTGRYQQRVGIDHVIYVDEKKRGMTLKALTLPEVLKGNGYVSGLIGKWHLGYPKKFFPTRQGFDEFVGFVSGNIDYFAHTDAGGTKDLWRREKAIEDPRYMTELIGDEALGFIDRNREKAFLLYVPFSAPHDPFQGPGDRASAGKPEITRKRNRTRATYIKMVEALDRNVGRILQHLKLRGLDDNTIVFFMSDNGGLPGVASNAPFRGYKGTLWEGGIRTPLFVKWPGRISAGVVSKQLVAGMDIFPTALEAAGMAPPAAQRLDGVSFMRNARGWNFLTHDTLFFHYRPPNAERGWKAITRDGWKYLSDLKGGEYLFHLTEDVGEQNNLVDKDPQRAVRMKLDFDTWYASVTRGAPKEPPRRKHA